MILVLVLCDVVLVAIEAGVDFRMLCIAGQIMTPSALGAHLGKSTQKFFLAKVQDVLQPDAFHSAHDFLVCESPHGHHAHHLTHTCHTLSIVILCIFMVELLLKIWIHGKEFFRSAFEVLDLVIVTLSLVCDLVIARMAESGGEGENGIVAVETANILLIVMRCWRIVRIVHGFYEIQYMDNERVEKQLQVKDAEIERLQAIVDSKK